MATAIAIVSGGMDSVTLAHLLASRGYKLRILSIDYGQKHRKELDFARLAADRLGAVHTLADLRSLTGILHGSALTDPEVAVPDGHYAAPTMRITVVPNRNAIMLAVAFGAAVAEGAEVVAVGVHAGDHPVYPDCRPEFITAFDAMQRLATAGHADPGLRLEAPFVTMHKHDIVKIGHDLGVPWAGTWSCYKGGENHCGTCGTCFERREAFELAGVADPTVYEEAAG